MAATVKTLLQNPGELYWGTRSDDPEYHYGIALDQQEGALAAQLVYVLTNFDEYDEEALVTPDTLLSCFTVGDLENTDIFLSDIMDDCPPETKGWYCIELSVFKLEHQELLERSSEGLNDYLGILLQALDTTPEELQDEDCILDDYTFFDLLDELCGISDKIDRGDLRQPLPFQFHLIGDALMGWQSANEEDFR